MCVEVFYTEFYPDRSRNGRSTAGNSFTHYETYNFQQAGFHQTHSCSAFIKDFYGEFYEYLKKS